MDRSDIVVKPYRAEDTESLLTLFARSVREVASRDYSPAQIEAWAQPSPDREGWAARLAGRGGKRVAERGGLIAGFSDLEPDGHIDMMFVHPEHQGAGVASALLTHIEAMAGDQRTGRLFTEASITARPFFERRGFRLVTAQQIGRNGQTFRNYRMERGL
jgi:putative acetyltransferase